jgi:hemerythrin-like domain-containing protein
MKRSAIPHTRRQLIARGAALGVTVSLALWAPASGKEDQGKDAGRKGTGQEADVAPAEDLMREHGVLERVLLIYDACLTRLAKRDASPLPVMVNAADVIRRFIEDYHEKLEEEFLFPRFESAGTLVDLVGTLRVQHQRGRVLTDEIRTLAQTAGPAALENDARLRAAVDAFVRMYRPHAAREDTVLFPAFRKLVSEKQYRELGEQFEDKEHALFGERGFQGIVDHVAELEKTLDIYDLNRFTPA